MAFQSLLKDRCTIQSRTVVTSGMTDTETFTDAFTNVSCRKLTNTASSFDPNKAQYGTMIKTRFALKASQSVSIRQRIIHSGRTYDIVEVIEAGDATTARHKVAVCEAIAGTV